MKVDRHGRRAFSQVSRPCRSTEVRYEGALPVRVGAVLILKEKGQTGKPQDVLPPALEQGDPRNLQGNNGRRQRVWSKACAVEGGRRRDSQGGGAHRDRERRGKPGGRGHSRPARRRLSSTPPCHGQSDQCCRVVPVGGLRCKRVKKWNGPIAQSALLMSLGGPEPGARRACQGL